MNDDAWKRLRYTAIQQNGMLLSQPAQLYFAQLVGTTAAQSLRLYDSTNVPQNLLAALVAPAFEAGATYPPKEQVSVGLMRGLYVSYSTTGFTGVLQIGFDRQ